MKTTTIIEDSYTREYMPEYIGKTLVVKYWHNTDEDSIWVDCIEDPKLSGWVFYLYLNSWRIGKED